MKRKIITVDDVRRKFGYNSKVKSPNGIIVGKNENYIEFLTDKWNKVNNVTFDEIKGAYKADHIQLAHISFYDEFDKQEKQKFQAIVLFYD